MEFSQLVYTRKSKRWFNNQVIDRNIIQAILEEASQAPSFMNHQPWHIAVVSGGKLTEIAYLLEQQSKAGSHQKPFPWPEKWPKPHDDHIAHTKKGQKRQIPDDALGKWFYYSPITLYIHIHEELNEWSLFDCGAFAQTLMLAAENRGIQSVPQAKVANEHNEIARLLGLSPERKIILGITMGYADSAHPNNQINTTRDTIDNWVSWHD